MDLYPQNLGSRWHAALAGKRAAAFLPRRGHRLLDTDFSTAAVPERLGPLGRAWVRGGGMNDAAAATGLAAMGGRARRITTRLGLLGIGYAAAGLMALLPGPEALPASLMMFSMAAAAGTGALLLPRALFQRVHGRPLASQEIEELLPQARDTLERAYLTLAVEIVRQTVPPAAEKDLRDALRALGEAIENLPFVAESGGVEALRSEAAAVRAEARLEADAVAAASLARQADALERRADAVARSNTLVRRAGVLHQELVAQTEALRAGLLGFHAGTTDIAGLAELADAVRGVATEAVSTASAREELDASAPLTVASEETDRAPLRVRQG